MIMRRSLFLLCCILPIATELFAVENDDEKPYGEKLLELNLRNQNISANLEKTGTIAIKSGAMLYKQNSIQTTTGGSQLTVPTTNLEKGLSFTNISLEGARYIKKDIALFAGYRLAMDTKSKRTLYQAGFAGARYFPWTLGVPIESRRFFSLLRYDFTFKPYVESGASLGRYLIRTYANLGVLDVSSEFYGGLIGAGCLMQATNSIAADLEVLFEQSRGYGPIKFSASTLFILLGMTYFY